MRIFEDEVAEIEDCSEPVELVSCKMSVLAVGTLREAKSILLDWSSVQKAKHCRLAERSLVRKLHPSVQVSTGPTTSGRHVQVKDYHRINLCAISTRIAALTTHKWQDVHIYSLPSITT